MSNQQTTSFLEYDKELHEEAGLVFAGFGGTNEPEYIGTDKAWRTFTKLTQ